jgi:glutathionylspermidine synthase
MFHRQSKEVNRVKVNPISKSHLEELGFSWHTDEDGSDYVCDELVVISQTDAENLYNAGNEIYDMMCEAGDYVIKNNLFHELGIPFNLVDMIKSSWENDVHWHLYGRFDFAGGINGEPIKLLEFNADTPTSLFETAIVQWAMLKYNNLDEESQFNNIYEAIGQNFQRLITLDEDISDFENLYEGWRILFSSIEGIAEEEVTVRLLQQIAQDYGFETGFEYLTNVGFNENEGVSDSDGNIYEYWFKLFPWEDIGIEEGELVTILNDIMTNQKAIILNPAYTLMFQSKGMLKILYDLFPNSPYLLETAFEPLSNKKYVEKKVFGREGANMKIFDENNNITKETSGEYDNHISIYQEYVNLPKDENNLKYQAGVFFAYESCGVGFRRGGEILDNSSKFIGHIIK